MDLAKYLTVLIVLCLEGGETGGGGKHHDHVRIHLPEFHHHDHHKKVITIHHHHHKPKKEHHHHHHHHHHKPQIPHGHHYNHKKVHLKTHTVSKGTGHHHGSHGHHGHKHHGHHGHHHGHHGHHGHYGHHGHDHHNDAPVIPTFSNSPSAIPSYEDDYSTSYYPSNPSYDSVIPTTGFTFPQTPQVRGISHTVKQVKVFDSLPGALPNKGITQGYEVTEEGDEGDEEIISINNLQNTYPATFAYVRGVAPQPTNDPFAGITSQSSIPPSHDPFAASPETTSLSGGIGAFTGTVQSDPFSSAAPTQAGGIPTISAPSEFPGNFQAPGFDGNVNSFTGSGVEGPSFVAEENELTDDTPVSYTREAGIQQSTKTGNVETVIY